MADAKEKWVMREGKDWMELRKVDPRGRFWLVVGGTVALVGDVVRFPRPVGGLALVGMPSSGGISPLDAEIVVDSVTRSVILPECGRPTSRFRDAMRLARLLEEAGLRSQAQIVRDWLRTAGDEEFRERDAA